MLSPFLQQTVRNLLRHKLQTLINIGSLAIGLTVFGFAFLYVTQELSYDRSWPDAERVHRLTVERRGMPGQADQIITAVSADERARLLDYFGADLEATTRRVSTGARLDGPDTPQVGLTLVDPQFFDVFQMELVEGDLARTLTGPGFIAVDEAMAERLALNGRVGERIAIQSFYDNTQKIEYELAAIYRLPQPTAIGGGILTLMHEYSLPLFTQPRAPRQFLPWESSAGIWAKLRAGLDTDEFNSRQPAFVAQLTTYDSVLGPERKISDHLFYRWQPLVDWHFNPLEFEAVSPVFGNIGRVATFAIVGLLVLLVGCSNSISLSLAEAIERRREIGVRKAAGAMPKDILREQLGTSLLRALLALIPAIAALELLSPAFQAMLPFRVEFGGGLLEYVLLALIACVVGLACGAYPAFVLASVRPQSVLRAGTVSSASSGTSLRTFLVAVQFCLASVLLIGTAALYLQLAVARAQPLGFNADNIVLAIENDGVSAEVMRDAFKGIPGVTDVILGVNPPNADLPVSASGTLYVRNIGDSQEVRPEQVGVSVGFFELMGVRLLAGRTFDERFDRFNQESATFADGSTRNNGSPIVLNAAAVGAFGFDSPEQAVGQSIFIRYVAQGQITHQPMRIVGVVENNQYASFRRRPGPQLYVLLSYGGRAGNLMVKYEEAVEGTMRDRLQEVAQSLNGRPLNGMIFTNDYMAAAFRQEQNESKLLLICGALAILLASFGLYGLAAFALKRQVKEVGVRKVMGASVGNIVRLYLWRFSRPIIIANLVAWPVAIYFVLQWIERFPYQLERAWLLPICIAALTAVLAIAMLTVSVITTRAATANPVRSLRYE